MKRLLAPLLMLGLLTACGSAPPVPEDHYYRLPDITISKTESLAAVLAVKRLLADGLHSERSLLYSHADKPLQIKRYHYHHWVKSPPRMIQDALITALRRSGVAKNVVSYDAAVRSEYTLKGKLRKFEQLKDSSQSKVLIDLELSLEDRTGKTIYIKDFNIKQEAESSATHDLVEAYGTGIQKILDQFINGWRKLKQ